MGAVAVLVEPTHAWTKMSLRDLTPSLRAGLWIQRHIDDTPNESRATLNQMSIALV